MMPDWSIFDRIYCVHYVPQTRKLPRLIGELKRVGIMSSGRLTMRYTFPSRYDHTLFRFANESGAAFNAGCSNLGYATLGIMEEAKAFGYGRILVLENDVAFLKDLDEIAVMLKESPDMDVVQYDKFVTPNGEMQYRRILDEWAIGGRYFNAGTVTFYSGACFSLSGKAISRLAELEGEALAPSDSYFVRMAAGGLSRACAVRNMAVQVVYGGTISADAWGVNSHHDGYVRAGVDYADYSLPDGYGYGSAV